VAVLRLEGGRTNRNRPDKLTISFVEVPRDSYARDGILLSDRTDLK
jgi:hypothetical protein